jgi:soluble lytic murein transglycosylase
VGAVLAAGLTGRFVVPGLSGKVYPIKYQSEIAFAADEYGIDPYLLAAVARTESGFDPLAESGDGALGIMQLLPTTADWLSGLDSWKGRQEPALTDPQDSIELGACYLAYLQKTFDGHMAAVAAYNAGQGIVRQWVKEAGGIDSFTAADIPYPETKEFVRRVQHWQAMFEEVHPNAFSGSGVGSLGPIAPVG